MMMMYVFFLLPAELYDFDFIASQSMHTCAVPAESGGIYVHAEHVQSVVSGMKLIFILFDQ